MTVENVNPWTGQVEYRYAYFGPAETEARLAAAAKAFPAWSALSFTERAAYLERVAALLREHSGRTASDGSSSRLCTRGSPLVACGSTSTT